MSDTEAAVSCFPEQFNCTQAIFSTYAPKLGLDRELALRIACPFGGGMGRMGEVCGAVTGAFMVLGLKYGTATAGDVEGRGRAYELAREFAERFKARHHNILCRELLGHDISTPEGRQAALETGLFHTLCPQLVRDAAEILEEML